MTNHLGGARYVADSTPYPWPYNGNMDAGMAVLAIEPNCLWPGQVDSAVIDAAAEVARAVAVAGGSVISVITSPPPSATTSGAADGPLHFGGLSHADATFRSAGIDGFYGSGLEPHLRAAGVQLLVLVGLGAETSIHSTMRTANDMGFECLFVTDACQPYDIQLTPHTVSMIEMSGGIFGAVASSASLSAALLERNRP